MAPRPSPKIKDDKTTLKAVTKAQALLNDHLQNAVTDKKLVHHLFGILDTPKVAER